MTNSGMGNFLVTGSNGSAVKIFSGGFEEMRLKSPTVDGHKIHSGP